MKSYRVAYHNRADTFSAPTITDAAAMAAKAWGLRKADAKLLHIRGVGVTVTTEPVPKEYRELAEALKRVK